MSRKARPTQVLLGVSCFGVESILSYRRLRVSGTAGCLVTSRKTFSPLASVALAARTRNHDSISSSTLWC